MRTFTYDGVTVAGDHDDGFTLDGHTDDTIAFDHVTRKVVRGDGYPDDRDDFEIVCLLWADGEVVVEIGKSELPREIGAALTRAGVGRASWETHEVRA